MRKKNILLGMIAVAILSLSGCGNEKNDKTTEMVTEVSATEEVATTEVTTEAQTEETTEATTETTEVTTEATTEDAKTTDNKISVVGDGLNESQEYYENMYRDVLNVNYKIVTGGVDSYEYSEGTSGVGEVVMGGNENAMDTIGYTFVDTNNDGIGELIIGSINEEKSGKYYGSYIYSVYTYDAMPQLILEGWSRNRCFLLNDGTYYTEGSSGAMYSVFENYKLEANKTELTCIDYYFTKEKDETFEEYGFYHNTTGEWDISVSEELSEEKYWDIAAAYSERTITLEFTPFANYEYVDTEASSKEVSVKWITKEELHETQMGNFVADTSEFEVIAAITAHENIKNLKILSLTYEESDDMGNTIFSVEELYTYGDFEAGIPFAITLTMYGTIPSYGISYETADGMTHYYAISESGMDGSAVLVEFVAK
ncbi:MAG: hypothetical protein IJZ96_06330 [Lachnospiraceae bacterium]|nr:hypothetical protein [Lachnospiraceae bacterium]